METIQVSISRQMDKQNVVYLHKRILFSHTMNEVQIHPEAQNPVKATLSEISKARLKKQHDISKIDKFIKDKKLD